MKRRTAVLAAALAPLSGNALAGIIDWYNGVTIGAPLPKFDVEYLGTGPAADRKLLLVDFWATWCASCREEFPRLNALHSTYGARGLEVVGITMESKAVVQAFLTKVDVRYKVGTGGARPLQRALGVKAIPYAILVDRKHTIVWRGQASQLEAAHIEPGLGSDVT